MGFIDVGKEKGLEQSEKTNKSLAATRANRETTKETPPPSLLTMFERTWKYDQKGKRFSAENNTNKKHYIARINPNMRFAGQIRSARQCNSASNSNLGDVGIFLRGKWIPDNVSVDRAVLHASPDRDLKDSFA